MSIRFQRAILACSFVAMLAGTAEAAPARPAAPQATVGADLKQLVFDWNDVAGAAYYQVLVRTAPSSQYHALGERIPRATTTARFDIAVHLERWSQLRFVVAACNANGCANSSALSVQQLMPDAIGYFKASNTGAGDRFGRAVQLSADGRTLVVAAPFESGNASGVNGNQAYDGSPGSGAVYVYRRNGGRWRQEAYLKAGVNQVAQAFGDGTPIGHRAIAVNGDGSMIAVGAPQQDVNGISRAGAVFIYRRAANGRWSVAGTLHSPTPLMRDYFGFQIDMSRDARTLTAISIQPQDGEGNPLARTHVFVRPGDQWQYSTTFTPLHPDDQCQSVRLSGDGNTIVSNCNSDVGPRIFTYKRAGDTWVHVADLVLNSFMSRQLLALDFDASVLALSEGGVPRQVGIYRWNGANWAREAGFAAPATADPSGSPAWGDALALDGDGSLLAIGDTFSPTGSPNLPGQPVDQPVGAVYLYERVGGATPGWRFRNVVSSPNPDVGDSFGGFVALSDSGRTLAIGAPGEDSAALGIDGERFDNSASESGAVYLY